MVWRLAITVILYIVMVFAGRENARQHAELINDPDISPTNFVITQYNKVLVFVPIVFLTLAFFWASVCLYKTVYRHGCLGPLFFFCYRFIATGYYLYGKFKS